MTPQVLYNYPDRAGTPWRPSNGTEGDIFMDAFCYQCKHEKFSHTQDHADAQCPILNKSILGWPDGPEEWQFNAEGWPVCTAWQFWKWDRDDDGNFRNEPPPVYPDDPNQLCLPFIFEEIGVKENQPAYI